MRHFFACAFLALLLLPSCTTVETDRSNRALPVAMRTQMSFEPLTREQAERYIESEQHVFKTNTAPLIERQAALQAGRDERYKEISKEFPDCYRQKICQSHLSQGSVKRFERYNDLAREIHAYDKELIEVEASINDWTRRLDLRERAILNRFLVNLVLEIPKASDRFQGVLIYSLQNFDTRRLLAHHLIRYAGDEIVPSMIGDFDFRMLGRPVDEAAVLATFEVYLMPNVYAPPEAPTRFVVTMLVNTHQLDFRYYNKDFLRAWAAKFGEPLQQKLQKEVYCGMYSIAGATLAPRLDSYRVKSCTEQRNLMQAVSVEKLDDRMDPNHWMLPLAYYPMGKPGAP